MQPLFLHAGAWLNQKGSHARALQLNVLSEHSIEVSIVVHQRRRMNNENTYNCSGLPSACRSVSRDG
jgi:hypothetical protein